MYKVCEDMDRASDQSKMRNLCLKQLVAFQDTVDRCGRFPTDAEASTMAQSSEKLLVLYGGLARRAAESGKMLWSIVNKFHFFHHLSCQGQFYSLKCVSTYQPEDYMRHVTSSASGCAVGTPTFKVNSKLAERVRVARYIEITRGFWPTE